MDHVCGRCARRLSLWRHPLSRGQTVPISKSFSSSKYFRKDENVNESPGIGSSISEQTASDSTGSRFGAFIAQAVKDSNRTGTVPSGQILRRSRPPPPSKQRSSLPSKSPPGQLLRRTAAPRSAPRSGSERSDGTGSTSQTQTQRGRRRPTQKRNTARYDESEDNADNEEAMEKYIKKAIDPPANPTESIPYKPQGMTIEELRADWPDTPLSATGLVESVQQRIEHLARRIPHGYKTPEQLAERYHDGEFIRFESAEEKDKVLNIAANMARERAVSLTERKGQEIPPADMTFEDMNLRVDEKNSLTDRIVKGIYPKLEKQRMPFLDNVVRNLRNNASYGSSPTAKFMEKIQTMMPPPSATKGAPAKQQKRA